MRRSPCIELNCDLKDQDKNNPTCLNCEAVKAYTETLGGLTTSLPIGATDMTRRLRWTEQDDEFIRKNYNTMRNQEISDKLNRTPNAIANRMSQKGLRRDGFKRCSPVKTDTDTEHVKTSEPLPRDDVEDQPFKKDFVIIYFQDCAHDLYNRFLSFAKSQFREPEKQILYMIDRAVTNHERQKKYGMAENASRNNRHRRD